MSLHLLCTDVDLEKDWDELFQSFYTSWSDPVQPIAQLTFAHLGTNTTAERVAFESAKQDLLEEARASRETLFWIKCVDDKTNKIVGGMCYKHEPEWPSDHCFMPSWFEEGSEMQRLSKGCYEELLKCRKRCMKREHMYGEFAWVEPAYRASNASQIILEYGLKKVDAMGLEAYSEVNQFSAPLALNGGFIIVGWADMNFAWNNNESAGNESVPSKNVSRIARALQAHPIAAAWRPVGGKYVEGQTVLPWTGRARDCAKL